MAIKTKIGNWVSKATNKLGLIPEANQTNVSVNWGDAGTNKEIWTGYSEEDAVISDELLYTVLKKSPEIVGVIRVLVHDILADGWVFEGTKGAVNKALIAEEDMEVLKVWTDALWDLFTTGDAWILKLSVTPEQIKTVTENVAEKLSGIDITKGITKSQVFDEVSRAVNGAKKTRALQLLKSSTVRVVLKNEYGEIDYIQQKIGSEIRKYDVNDVIHLSLTNIGGSVYGFTPLQPLLSDIANLINGKEYLGKVFEEVNPPIIYNLPDATSGEDDRNYQLLRKQLQELKKKKNKLKSILTTGKLNTTQIQAFAPQDQISEIIKYFTSIILFAWGVPPHRVPFIQQKISQTPKESDNGYFKSIDYMQDILQAQFNKQLWGEFNVRMKFNKSYRIDELQQATVCTMMMDRNAITVEEAREKVGFVPQLPNGTMPVSDKHQRGSFNTIGEGDKVDDSTVTPEGEDNKVKQMFKFFDTSEIKGLVYYNSKEEVAEND